MKLSLRHYGIILAALATALLHLSLFFELENKLDPAAARSRVATPVRLYRADLRPVDLPGRQALRLGHIQRHRLLRQDGRDLPHGLPLG